MGQLLKLTVKEHNLGRFGRIKQTVPRFHIGFYEVASALFKIGTFLMWVLAALGFLAVLGILFIL